MSYNSLRWSDPDLQMSWSDPDLRKLDPDLLCELLVICFRYQKSCFKNKMHLYFITIIMSYNSLRWSDPDLADHD
jgi:hypothetical protein